MKGTAMSLVMGGSVMLAHVSGKGSSASACDFKVPAFIHPKPSFSTFSCELSESCCRGLQDVEHMATVAKGGGKPQGGKGRVIRDLVATCGRNDQVELYECAIKINMATNGGRMTAMMQAKGCTKGDDPYPTGGKDGVGHCSIHESHSRLEKATFDIDGVSTGCCEAVQNFVTAADDGHQKGANGHHKWARAEWHSAQCGMIGHCGKQDQRSIYNAIDITHPDWGHPAQVELLEMFDMTNVAPQEIMATFLTSEGEVIEDEADVTEDDATEDDAPKPEMVAEEPRQMMAGFCGFLAGAAVVGLAAGLKKHSQALLEQPLVA